MPFIRAHGQQLALVHGSRQDGKVVQEVLFTLYSRSEANAAIGAERGHFEAVVEALHPTLTFSWPQLRSQIAAQMGALPETYDQVEVRLRRDFRAALVAVTRQLLLADPLELDAAADLIAEHGEELDYLVERIAWRREMAKSRKRQASPPRDEFLWQYTRTAGHVPFEADEEIHDMYDRGELAALSARAKLLVEAFPNYADGYNILGLVAMDEQRLDDAITWFQRTAEAGRASLPKRVRKDAWWTDHDTRPYMRGLSNLACAQNRAGRFEDALATAERVVEVDRYHCVYDARPHVLLNLAHYEEAEALMRRLPGITSGYERALVLIALRRPVDAWPVLVRAVLGAPRTGQQLLGGRVPAALSRHEQDEDRSAWHLQRNLHAFLPKHRRAVNDALRAVLQHPVVAPLVAELHQLEGAAQRGEGAGQARYVELRSVEFVECVAATVQR